MANADLTVEESLVFSQIVYFCNRRRNALTQSDLKSLNFAGIGRKQLAQIMVKLSSAGYIQVTNCQNPHYFIDLSYWKNLRPVYLDRSIYPLNDLGLIEKVVLNTLLINIEEPFSMGLISTQEISMALGLQSSTIKETLESLACKSYISHRLTEPVVGYEVWAILLNSFWLCNLKNRLIS